MRTTAVADSSRARFTTLARIDRRVVYGAALPHLVGDQLVALVEKQNAEMLLFRECHRGAAIFEHRVPRRQHRPRSHLAGSEILRGRLADLEFGDDCLARFLDLGEPRGRGGNNLCEGAEFLDQALRERLYAASR
jgi:hypothetical protein